MTHRLLDCLSYLCHKGGSWQSCSHWIVSERRSDKPGNEVSVTRHNLSVAHSRLFDRLKNMVAETLLHIVSVYRDVGCGVILGLHYHRGQSSGADPVFERVRIQSVVCRSDTERSL